MGEMTHDSVASLLDGKVKLDVLEMEPGALVLFRGGTRSIGSRPMKATWSGCRGCWPTMTSQAWNGREAPD